MASSDALNVLDGDSIDSIPVAQACGSTSAICAPKDGVNVFSCSCEHIFV